MKEKLFQSNLQLKLNIALDFYLSYNVLSALREL